MSDHLRSRATAPVSQLLPGHTLGSHSRLSDRGRCRLTLSDGDLVLTTRGGAVVWRAGLEGAHRSVMSLDGVPTLEGDAGQALWRPDVEPCEGAWLEIRTGQGGLVLTDGSRVLWRAEA